MLLQWPTAWSQIPPEKRRADTPAWVGRSHGVSPYHTDLSSPTCTCHQGGAALHGPQDWSASSSISLFPWTKNVLTSIRRNFLNIVWFIIQGVVNCTQQSTLQGAFQFQIQNPSQIIKDPKMETFNPWSISIYHAIENRNIYTIFFCIMIPTYLVLKIK